jgi:2-methylisocitrate lyase-like PEP mutase family enzyme
LSLDVAARRQPCNYEPMQIFKFLTSDLSRRKTPIVGREQVTKMGVSLILYANAALQGALEACKPRYGALRERGSLEEASGLVATFGERRRLVDKPPLDGMKRRTTRIPKRCF